MAADLLSRGRRLEIAASDVMKACYKMAGSFERNSVVMLVQLAISVNMMRLPVWLIIIGVLMPFVSIILPIALPPMICKKATTVCRVPNRTALAPRSLDRYGTTGCWIQNENE